MHFLYQREDAEAAWEAGALKELDEIPNVKITDVQIKETHEANRVQLYEQIEREQALVEEEVKKVIEVDLSEEEKA